MNPAAHILTASASDSAWASAPASVSSIQAGGASLLEWLAGIDPTPFFVLSLLPYLAFLALAGRVNGFPKLALRGFQLTLLFVAVTIAASILALRNTGRQLADVDSLHGGAEAFLTLANLLVAIGFQRAAASGEPPQPSTGEVNKPYED